MVAITWLMLFAQGISWFCFSPMISTMMEDLAITGEQVGIIIALVPLSLVILCIPGGLLADHFGVRSTVLLGGILMGTFGLLRGFATDFTTLAVTTFLCGAGYSIAYPNMPKVTGIWFPRKEYAFASGVMFTGMEVGMALPFIIVPAVLLPWAGSWQGVFFTIGALTLAFTALWTVLSKEHPKSATVSAENSPTEFKGVPFRESLFTVLRSKSMWVLMITTFFLLAPQIGLLGFLQTLLESKGIDPTTAGLTTSMISWFMIPSSLIIPILSDRVGLRKPFIWVLSLLAGITLYLTGTTVGAPLWASAIVYGFLIGGIAPIVLAMPVEIVGPLHSATAGGFMLVGGYLGATVAPWLVGSLWASSGSFATAIIACTVLTEIDVICALMLKESRKDR
jgi:MFS family permease